MSDVAIRVVDLGTKYRIGAKQIQHQRLYDLIADTVSAPVRRTKKLLRGQASGAADLDETIWALKDVSFEVKRGEVVGVIGRNGAGKSTLLKILTRITDPTVGYAEVFGRVGSLLEVGTGFHPELTGRENVYLNGTILGMGRKEIENKFDEIIEFAGVGRFIDTPVKHYSSGMHVRLAFAVAAHLEPEILLIDEVLAVGDVGFQQKCLGKMSDVARGGRTILFVSHNLAAIQSLCDWVVILEEGHMQFKGDLGEGISRYLQMVGERNSEVPLARRQDRDGTGRARLIGFRLLDSRNREVTKVPSGESLCFELRVWSAEEITRGLIFMITIYDQLGAGIAHLNSNITGSTVLLRNGETMTRCSLEHLPLRSGIFSVNVALVQDGQFLDHISKAFQMEVVDGDFFGTGRSLSSSSPPLLIKHTWESAGTVGEDY